MTKPSQTDLPFGCLIAFCVPFVAVGVAAGGMIYWTLWTTYQTNQWDEVPCVVEFAKLERHSDGEGTSYSIDTRYQYEYRGDPYTSTGVCKSMFTSDSERQWRRELVDTLNEHIKEREPYHCFVNPGDPSEAVLVRDIRFFPMFFMSIFAVAFGLGGSAFASNLFAGPQSGKRAELAKASRKPWLMREDWESGQIRYSAWRESKYKLLTIAYLLATTLPIAMLVPRELRSGNYWAWLGLIAPSGALLLAFSTFASIRRQLSYGVPLVQLLTVPGVIGGRLQGSIHGQRASDVHCRMRVVLACNQKSSDSNGDSSMPLSENLWQSEQIVAPDHRGQSGIGMSVFPFQFTIPYGLPSSNPNSTDRVDWVLLVSRADEPANHAIRFELPVFETEESSPEIGIEEGSRPKSEAESSQAEDLVDMLAATGVRHQQFGNRQCFRITGQKTFSTMAMMLFFAVGFGVAAASIVQMEGPWFLAGVFAVLAALILWGFAHTMMWRCRIDVESRTVAIRSGAIPWLAKRVYPIDQFERVLVRMTTQTNQKGYYQVVFQTGDGHRFVVGKGILGRRSAALYGQQLWHRVIGSEPPEVETLSFRDE